MKINQDVYKFFADNGCTQEFGSSNLAIGKLKAAGGSRLVEYLLSGDLSDKASIYTSKNVNRAVANLACSFFDSARLIKTASRIQSLGCIKKSSPVLDLGCENGVFLCCLAALNPQAPFIGVDSNEAAIRIATKRASDLGLKNLAFICDTAEHFVEGVYEKRLGLILSHCFLGDIVPGFWAIPQAAPVFRSFLRNASIALADGGRLITSDWLRNDQERLDFTRFVSQCNFSFVSKESATVEFDTNDHCSFFVFKKGAGSPVQMATIKKLKRV